MKKAFLLLPLTALVLAGCSSERPAPVVAASESGLPSGVMKPVPNTDLNSSAGWQTEVQPTPMPSTMGSTPTYSQPSVPQPVYTPPSEPVMKTKVVTQTVKVKKKVPKKTVPQNFEIPRDADNKPMYNQIDKGFYNGDSYTVRKGDTMYLVSYISGKDAKEIARLNNMSEPYQLHVGKVLKLSNGPQYEEVEQTITKRVEVPVAPQVTYSQGPNGTTYSSQGDITGPVKASVGSAEPPRAVGVVASVGTASAPSVSQNSTGIQANVGSTAPAPILDAPSAVETSAVKWQWPTAGRIVSRYSAADAGNKGIDIAGSKGQDVRAAAAGRVVYAGNALRGYGNLIIIKHNDDFLSAYAHNDSIKVDEQDEVKAGEKIATMGNTGTDSTKLHFEIRYKGKSVDPTRYLPKR